MGWLKKVGIILGKSAEFLVLGGPVISALIPGKKDDYVIAFATSALGQIIDVVVKVEAMAAAVGMDGVTKLRAAGGLVSEILIKAFGGRKIKDLARWKRGVDSIINGVVDCLSSLDDGGIDTNNPM